MSRATLVPITPAVLGWAIRESGYSPEEVAERVGVSPDTLGSWLARTAQPDLTRFKKLVSVLKRPSATFLLPGPPTLVRPQVEFRHPPDSGRTLLNPVEQRYLREASRLQRALAWVLGELQEEPTPLPRAVVGSDVSGSGRRRGTITAPWGSFVGKTATPGRGSAAILAQPAAPFQAVKPG